MFYVYVVRSMKDGRLYTGMTGDLQRRLGEHNRGGTSPLRGRRPVRLVYSEEYTTRAEALARERYFKTPEGGVLKRRLVSEVEEVRCD
ncbi:MAG: GIY-YIG nuclease family protein [Dehalococcoidia bacterium]